LRTLNVPGQLLASNNVLDVVHIRGLGCSKVFGGPPFHTEFFSTMCGNGLREMRVTGLACEGRMLKLRVHIEGEGFHL